MHTRIAYYACALLLGVAAVFRLSMVAAEPEEPLQYLLVENCEEIPPAIDKATFLVLREPIHCRTPKTVHFVGEGHLHAYAIDTTNLHFVVHESAALTMIAEKRIRIERDEGSASEPLLVVAGKVKFEVKAGTPADLLHGTMEDEAGVMHIVEGGSMEADATIGFTSNSITVTAKNVDKGDEETDLLNNLDPSAHGLSDDGGGGGPPANPAANGSEGAADPPSAPEAAAGQASSASPPPREDAGEPRREPVGRDIPSTTPSSPATPRRPRRTRGDNADTIDDYAVKSGAPPEDVSPYVRPRPRRDSPWAFPPRFSLKCGETLTDADTLHSRGLSAKLWLGMDGSTYFSKCPEGHLGQILDLRATMLLKSDRGRLRQVWRLRKERRREAAEEQHEAEMEDNKNENKSEKQKKKKNNIRRGWFPWVTRRKQATYDLAKKHNGEIAMRVDEHGCVETTVDGIRVTYKCGKWPFQWVNRFGRETCDRYEVRVPYDGMEICLDDRVIWGVTAHDLE